MIRSLKPNYLQQISFMDLSKAYDPLPGSLSAVSGARLDSRNRRCALSHTRNAHPASAPVWNKRPSSQVHPHGAF